MNKAALLNDFAARVVQAAAGGLLSSSGGKRPLAITQVQAVAGPRAGALQILADLDTGRLLRALSRDDCAALRQFVPWDFSGEPAAYMRGRYLRVEAGWSPELAESDIPLRALAPHPRGNGRWIVGKNEHGRTVAAEVNVDRTPHWLFSGATGAGKTVALRSAVTQLAADPHNRLVVVDGKRGASFRGYRLAGMVAPVAIDPDAWRSALVWAAAEMQGRYEQGHNAVDRLIVVVDEVQEVILADAAAAEAVRQLVTLGRDAGVHCLIATQHPIVKALGGPTVTRNLVGRLALRVADYDASRVAVGGSTPRADHLLGHGDAYAVAPATIQRVQVAYTTPEDLAGVTGDPAWDDWPETDVADLDQAPGGRPSPWPAPAEVGASLTAAALGRGRPWLKDQIEGLDGLTRPGSDRARRLLALGRDTLEWLEDNDWMLHLSPG